MGMFLRVFVRNLRVAALWIDSPPWQSSWPDEWQDTHWLFWILGYAWLIAGLILGAVVAPSLTQFAGRSNTFYQGALAIGAAVLAGVLAQSLVWFMAVSAFMSVGLISDIFSLPKTVRVASGVVVFCILAVLPFVGVGYALHRYFAWAGSGQGLVPIALVGALLVKTIPTSFIKGIVTGAVFKWFIGWLRGKPKPSEEVVRAGVEAKSPNRDA